MFAKHRCADAQILGIRKRRSVRLTVADGRRSSSERRRAGFLNLIWPLSSRRNVHRDLLDWSAAGASNALSRVTYEPVRTGLNSGETSAGDRLFQSIRRPLSAPVVVNQTIDSFRTELIRVQPSSFFEA